uniref:RNA-directed DNA polymerase, eukaryota n=1 Tax=Tanacetum cinerariifolium TaxID=118510 RepID=A0A6L2NP40_TANCI|nr:RNA-directed DNA polymerase, eukaryota [Tanacetum cinerariifolium]
MEACDPFICNDSYKSKSSNDEEDVKDDESQSGDKVTVSNDVEKVSESSCLHNNNFLYDNNHNNIMHDKDKVLLDDPFNLYDIMNKRKDSGNDLKYPPSFTPSVINVEKVNKKLKGVTSNKVNEHVNSTSNKLEESVPKGKLSLINSVCSKRVLIGGSILQLMDELVKETKMESMELVTIKMMWGNYSFDYALSSSLGNSRGILCVWEPTLFVKDNIILLDNFLVVMGANAFNSFISLASLIDFPLNGYAYTWAHKTANKMKDIWKSLATVDSNGIINLKKKLQALKIIIKQWTKNAKNNSYKVKISIQFKLSDINKILNQGGSNEEILSDRSLLLKELNEINPIDSLEAAQKSKVRWAIEGDENKKFFHGLISDVWSAFVSNRQILDGLFSGIPIDSSLTLSYLFFTNDAISISKWDSLNIRTIVNVLKCFHLASGLKINFHKSKLMGIGTRPEEVEAIATTIDEALNSPSSLFKRSHWLDIIHEDPWLDDLALKHKFSRLYALDNYKQITVVEKINHASMVDTFRQPTRGGTEEEQIKFLLFRMDGLILTIILDRWVWSLEATGEFFVKFVRQLIDDLILPKEEVATRWVKFMPIKINVFSWRFRLDKLPIRLNLSFKDSSAYQVSQTSNSPEKNMLKNVNIKLVSAGDEEVWWCVEEMKVTIVVIDLGGDRDRDDGEGGGRRLFSRCCGDDGDDDGDKGGLEMVVMGCGLWWWRWCGGSSEFGRRVGAAPKKY